ncbi:MAG: ABC transporter ATP-binding protein [Anaerolineae bacterium]
MHPSPEHAPEWKIKLDQLTKHFYDGRLEITALSAVSLEIPPGQFYVFVGPSGCGKTTLLEIVAGLQTKSAGDLLIHSQPTHASQPLTSMVFQAPSIFPWMSVRDNIAFGLKARGIDKASQHRITAEYIETMSLSGFERAFPHQLSGGMKQRVSIARAFANDPQILLMDEPFASLDAQNRVTLQVELLRIWEETQKTVLFVTHSIDEAILLADKIVVMTTRPGRVRDIIPVDFSRPRQIDLVRGDPEFGVLYNRVWQHLRNGD